MPPPSGSASTTAPPRPPCSSARIPGAPETDVFDICRLNGETVSGETVPGPRCPRFHDLAAPARLAGGHLPGRPLPGSAPALPYVELADTMGL
ncbi:hypothetical protein DR950_00430 [Kitasatospora xanthocidica]|uniref:Uncharacterized protein n=1 Tax=Kitasatospora xanthocidica TaxID=83382 RepID=A0A372ZMJ3_9ACTN|nr:hypothetical protein DR950_00430 [Kitasatospora xanthocidica]